MGNKTVIKIKDPLELLDEFSKAIRKKKYTDRLRYDLWCEFREPDDDTLALSHGYPGEMIFVEYYFNNSYHCRQFNIDDNGFGQFIYDKFFNINKIEDDFITIGANTLTVNNALDKLCTNLRYNTTDATLYTLNGDNTNTTFNIEEEKKMSNMFKFDFGPCNPDRVKMSPYGMAIKNGDKEWVAYNTATGQVVNVDNFCFDIPNAFYKMPVALNQVSIGDIILHQGHVCFVQEVNNDSNSIDVIDVAQGEMRIVIPTTNMFNFNFVTKIVSLFNMGNITAPDENNPFGNIVPMMMMSEMMGNNDKDTDGFGKLFMMSALMGGQNPFTQMFAGFQPTSNQ